MPEFLSYGVGMLVGLGAIAMIAFPNRMMPEFEQKKKRFNAKHWGAYEDSHEEVDENQVVEVGVPSRKVHYVVGSHAYGGRK